MKNTILLLVLLCCTTFTFAQAPSYFKYQGVARNADNQAYSNTTLGIKISIIKDNGNGGGSGLVEYSEKHQIFTSPVGVFSLNIGNGNSLFGDIEAIDWSNASYWLKVEMDVNGGEDYVFMGNAQILPVPIAVHAMTVADKDDADADPENELQNLEFHGTTLFIEGANQVDLAILQDGVQDADSNPQNELQTLQFNANNNTLSLSDGGQVDLSSLEVGAGTDNQNLQLNGTNLSIESGNQVNLAILQDGVQDADSNPQNELQTLEFNANNNTLSLSDGGQVDLSSLEGGAGTDNQTLQLNGTNLFIEGGNQVNLAILQDGVQDADFDPQNELQTLQFNANNNTLSLSDGGQVDLSSLEGGAGTDNQNLQLNGTNLSIEGGNQVNLAILQDGVQDADSNPQNELQTLEFDPITNKLSISDGNIINLPLDVDDNDHSPTNELQTLGLNGNNLSLSNGGGQIDLSSFSGGSSLWSQGGGDDLYTQENVAIGFTASQVSSLEVKEDITIRKADGSAALDLFSNSLGGHFYLLRANGTGGNNDILINMDATTEGSLISIKNENGTSRGEWDANNSNASFALFAPNNRKGVDLLAQNTGSYLDLSLPNGSTAVHIASSIFGGSASFNGSTGGGVAFIGRNNGSPTEGKISIGNPSNSELLRLSVGSSDGAGVKAGHLFGASTQGRATFGLSTLNSDHKAGLLTLYNDGDPVVYVTGTDGGAIFLQKNSNNKNVYIGTTSGTDYRGRISLYDSADNAQAGIYVDSQNQGVIWADIKNFRMDHPLDDDKEIWYASIEGPEAAAYERGTTQLENGEAIVLFPGHFGLVANHETMTVMLTPLSADCKGLAVIEKTRTGFKVKELFRGTGTYSFDWEVKCVRKGYENYKIIRDKKDGL